MIRTRVFILRLAITFLTVVHLGTNVYGWNPIGPYTHEKITDDALDYANPEVYPDLHRFAEDLRDGSETEAHYPPGVPETEQRWKPEPQDWWDRTDGDKKCALQWYAEYDFHKTYTTIGYLLHCVEDKYVPSHIYICLHGIDTNHWTDSLENWVDNSDNYGYKLTGSTPWTWYDEYLKRTWYFWLNDFMDDDNEDNVADGAPLPLIPDYGDDYHSYWGLQEYEFGTYGYGGLIGDGTPGKNEGADVFSEPGRVVPDIAHEQLWKAMSNARSEMVDKSEHLPPIIPNDATHGQPSVSTSVFGPESPIVISFVAMENRQKTIFISILAGTTAIKDTSGKVWNGSATATYDLASCAGSDQLPWKSTIAITWDGDLGTGTLADGEHTIKIKAKDQDNNVSEERSLTVKYDKTAPTVTNTRK